MNIIAISNRVPALNKTGDQIVSFYRLNYLAKLGHSIDVVCFQSINIKDDNLAKQILKKKGIHVHFIQLNIFESILNLTKAMFNKDLPFQCAFFKSKKFSNKVKVLFKNKKIHSIYCVMIRVAPNIDWYQGKLLVEMIDSMGLNFLRRSKMTKGLKKWILKKEQKKASNYEKNLADRSYRSFVVSSIDQKKIASSNLRVLPLGVNIFNKKRKISKNPIIIFSGNMFYQPNVDAILWFVKHCWSNILKEEPKTKLLIVGSNPAANIILLANKYSSINITGRVPSVFNILNKATVSIAPMQSGSGMQIKILEAMACAIPVVCSTIGIGDIRAKVNKDLLVADTGKDFSQKVIYMIRSMQQNRIIGKNGQLYVAEKHGWENLNQKFINLCNLKKK